MHAALTAAAAVSAGAGGGASLPPPPPPQHGMPEDVSALWFCCHLVMRGAQSRTPRRIPCLDLTGLFECGTITYLFILCKGELVV